MFTLWFMGRPASGKSTIASSVEDELVERGYPIENLDGDELRKNLHPDLGFSREDRRTNNRRTAFICRLLNRNGIPTIVGMITPFREAQEQARDIIESEGDFVLVYVKCPLDVCEKRDPKGMYEMAREGKIEKFTGVSHPFQEPKNPDIVVDTSNESVEDCKANILSELAEMGVLEEHLTEKYEFDISQKEETEIKQDLQQKGHLPGEK
jgi:adenylylsulfate kinase